MSPPPEGARRLRGEGERARRGPSGEALRDAGDWDGPRWLRTLVGAAGGLAGLAVGGALLAARSRPPHLPELVQQHLGESGVTSAVTAVLLNYRAYDTLLELAVLAVAMVGVWSLDRGSREFGLDAAEEQRQDVLRALVRFAVPLAVVTAVYLTWRGSHGPGGAFQAGALLAGAGVLLAAGGLLRPPTAATLTVRAAVAAGLVAFGGVGVLVMPFTGAFLAYPPALAHALIVAVEVVLTVSIAVVLVELFVDVPAVPDPDPSLAHVDPTGDPLGRAVRRAEWSLEEGGG